jgi:hypothetical protein
MSRFQTRPAIDPSSKPRKAVTRRGLNAILMLALVAAGPVQAAVLLGPYANVAIGNPNQIDPADDGFGAAMASGDFDGDGIDDLAIADRQHPNLVRIHFGTVWTLGNPVANPFQVVTVPVAVVPGATLGSSNVLAAGDFTKDISNDDEVVLGVPSDSLSANHAGAVFVLDRRPEGNWVVAITIRQGFEGFSGISESGDRFGASLAVGGFDFNDRDDLAIGIPGETTGTATESGAVYIVYQGVAGLMNSNEEAFLRGANGLTGAPISDEGLGTALAAGDFNGDEISDLAVGIPGNACAGQANSGSVMVLLGRNDSDGLDSAGVTYWAQTTAGVLDDCEANDRFGSALAAGSFNATPLGQPRTDDLAIGVPGEALGGVPLAGAVAVLFGSSAGLSASNDLLISEADLPGGTLATTAFGSRLTAGQINASAGGGDNLVIAAPFATENGQALAGRAWVIPQRAGALELTNARPFALSGAYALGAPAAQDIYGSQLAIGDFNGDGDNDLAIAVPGHDGGASGSGAVQVMFQSERIFADDFQD